MYKIYFICKEDNYAISIYNGHTATIRLPYIYTKTPSDAIIKEVIKLIYNVDVQGLVKIASLEEDKIMVFMIALGQWEDFKFPFKNDILHYFDMRYSKDREISENYQLEEETKNVFNTVSYVFEDN